MRKTLLPTRHGLIQALCNQETRLVRQRQSHVWQSHISLKWCLLMLVRFAMLSSNELPTPRLLLRQWQPSNLEPFAVMNSDADVMRYYPSP